MRFAINKGFGTVFYSRDLGEVGCAVDAVDGCVAWRVNKCLRWAALYGVFHAVEGEFSAEKIEVFIGRGPRDEGLVVEQV